MKSKTSCFNKAIFKKNVTHFWPIWAVLLLFYLFLYPFMIYNVFKQLSNSNATNYSLTFEEIVEQSILLPELTQVFVNPVFLFFITLIAAGAVFSYLYTSRAAYTIHALPVTRKSLFITNYLSGLAFLWVPQIIGALLGILVGAGCGFNYIDIVFKGLIVAMGISFFFFSFHVFVGMFVGQLIAMPVFSLIINLLFVGCKLMFILLFSIIAYGITPDFWESRLDVLSPLYYMTSKIYVNITYSNEVRLCSGIDGGALVAGYVAAAVVIVAAAYMVYQKRQIETAGSLISVKWVTPVFRWGVGICGAFLCALLADAVVYYQSLTGQFVVMAIAALIFGAVFFFVAQMFVEKSFRVFKKKRFMECGIFAAVLAVLLLCIRGDVFGVEKKVPKADSVKEAYIACGGNFAGGEEGEDIEDIIKLHENILSHKKEYRKLGLYDEEESTYYVNVKYFLKNDTVLYRSYIIPVREEDLSDASSPAGEVVSLLAEPENYIKSVFGINYKENQYTGGHIETRVTVEAEGADTSYSSVPVEISAQQAQAVYEAFLKDVEEGNFAEQIGRGMSYTEEYKKSAYWNGIQLEYINKEGTRSYNDSFYYTDKRWSNFNSKSDTAYITFTADCENIIGVLLEEGIIESREELCTIWEVEQEEQAVD